MVYRKYAATSRPVRPSIKVEVVFGSPRNACRYVGICEMLSMEGGPNRALPACGCADRGRACIARLGTDRLLIHFVLSSLAVQTRRRQFGSGQLRLIDPFHLPSSIARRLGFEGAIGLPAGSYPVVPLGRHWSVALPVYKINV